MSAVLDPPLARHRLSRAQYDQMIDAGVFGPEEKLELLDGELIDMAPRKSRHATAVRLLEQVLREAFGRGFDVRSQLPLNLDDRSEPEPDIAVVEGGPRDYRDAHPATARLIVEVADSSLAYDLGRKLAAYARAGIPEYWVLDLTAGVLEVCRHPQGEQYLERRSLSSGDRVAPLAVAVPIAVADLLP